MAIPATTFEFDVIHRTIHEKQWRDATWFILEDIGAGVLCAANDIRYGYVVKVLSESDVDGDGNDLDFLRQP